MTLPLRRPWSINFYTLQLRTPAQSRRSRQGVTGPSSQYQEITMAKGQGRCHCHLDSNPHDKSISFRGEKAMPFFFFFFYSTSRITVLLAFFTPCCQFFFSRFVAKFSLAFFTFFFFFLLASVPLLCCCLLQPFVHTRAPRIRAPSVPFLTLPSHFPGLPPTCTLLFCHTPN